MYNLGEKKAFLNDLATKLLLSGASGDAVAATGTHYHHQRHTNLACELLSLEDLALFKINEYVVVVPAIGYCDHRAIPVSSR